MMDEAPAALRPFFTAQGWTPFPFQSATWNAYRNGQSGLVHASTGSGKTLALWMGTIADYLEQNNSKTAAHKASEKAFRATAEPIRLLWITPMRALANDLVGNLAAPVDYFQLPWSIEARTGDTSTATRKAQKAKLPTALVTTPESLTLLLSYEGWQERFASLQAIVVDEWHELLGSKRGVQTELAVARLRRHLPELRLWGASATLGNLQEATHVLCDCGVPESRHGEWNLIADEQSKRVEIATLIPAKMERFPWAGHLGLRMLPQVLEAIESASTSLIFTNTRSQCEIWFRSILNARPQWAAEIAVHHGSLDRELRSYVESRLRDGTMRSVVCTSSLDLGVDFSPVDLVVQVGSPKGIGRLLQRAGRSGHQPGAASRVLCVPTHAFELVEYAATRSAAERHELEARPPVRLAMDVLVQHLVSMSLAGGFREDQLLDEVRSTHAYRGLSEDAWDWAMRFVASGGPALTAYPQYAKLVRDGELLKPASPLIARMHRFSIGTIAGDSAMQVKLLRGQYLGTIEESFIARLKPRDRFTFAGRNLEFVVSKDMTAYVRIAKKASGVVPRWDGGRLPLSTQLAAEVRRKLASFGQGADAAPELAALEDILSLQKGWSFVPNEGQVLFEFSEHRGVHLS
jgi:ATP-dependent helicase Lhr and Lhr-like helicase